jgi:hypothetical protein
MDIKQHNVTVARMFARGVTFSANEEVDFILMTPEIYFENDHTTATAASG